MPRLAASTLALALGMAACSVALADDVSEIKAMNVSVVNFIQNNNHLDALPIAERAYAMARKQLPAGHETRLAAMNNLSLVYGRTGQREKGRRLLEELRSEAGEHLGKEHGIYANATANLGLIYYISGEHKKAEPLLVEGTALIAKTMGKENEFYALFAGSLAVLYYLQGKLDQADGLLTEIIPLMVKVRGDNHIETAVFRLMRGALLASRDECANAIPEYRRAVSVLEGVPGDYRAMYKKGVLDLGYCLLETSQLDEAETVLHKAVDFCLGDTKDNVVLHGWQMISSESCLVMAHNHLGQVYVKQGDLDQARASFQASIDAAGKKTKAKEPEQVVDSLTRLAETLLESGDAKAAEKQYQQGIAYAKKAAGRNSALAAMAMKALADFYQSTGKEKKGAALRKKAERILAKHGLAFTD